MNNPGNLREVPCQIDLNARNTALYVTVLLLLAIYQRYDNIMLCNALTWCALY